VVLVALLGPWVAPHNPLKLDIANELTPPSQQYPLGTDEVGRDVLSRLLYGAALSLQAGLIVVVVAGTVGTLVGACAGYCGGVVDDILMRVTDMFMAFPGLLLALVVAVAVGASLQSATVAISLVWWPAYARLVRGEVLRLRERDFVVAARAVGAFAPRIVGRHILPGIYPLLIVRLTMDIGYAILMCAGLSFIGAGAQEPTPEWGRMLAEAYRSILAQWWYTLFPGLAMTITVLGFIWMGDGLRDWLDPRLRRAG
jgi:peptide/nickel transport system permease protein